MSEDLQKLKKLEEEIRLKYNLDMNSEIEISSPRKEESVKLKARPVISSESIDDVIEEKPVRTEGSSSLRNVELRSLKACWRPTLKFKGQIGGTGKDMDFISLRRQIKAAQNKDPPYEENEIVQAVIDSVTAGTKLRRMLETSEEMSLDELLEELKPILQESTGKDLLLDLQNLRQESGDAQEFVMDGCELKNRIIKENIVSMSVAQEMLLETLETGFASEHVRNFMRPYLQGDISRSALLAAVKKAMRSDTEHRKKFENRRSARVNEVEVESCQHNGEKHLLHKQTKLLQKQTDELLDIRADIEELKVRSYSINNRNSFNNKENKQT